MKIIKIIILLSAFIIYSCGELSDDVVNSPNSKYTVSDITAPSSLNFNSADSSLVATIKIDNVELISQVWYNVVTSSGLEVIINNVAMYDDGNVVNNGDETAGDKVFSGKTYLGKSKASGKYILQFFIKDNVNNEDENTRVVGFHQLQYDNGENSYAPEISNLIMPDSISRGVDFVFSVKANDQNGLNDIKDVYFKFTRPDKTTSGSILMHDDGNKSFGDDVAGDGIYSFKNSFSDGTPLPDGSPNPAAQAGEWIFIFSAEDNGGLLSNQITHTILVK